MCWFSLVKRLSDSGTWKLILYLEINFTPSNNTITPAQINSYVKYEQISVNNNKKRDVRSVGLII